jgi:hypothetical protein
LRLNQETRTPSLHVPGAYRTRRHPTSRPSGHRVSDLCDHPRSPASGLLLLPRSSSLHAMPHLPAAHHETSKRDSPNEKRVKEKQNYHRFKFKPRQVNNSSESNQVTVHLVSQQPQGDRSQQTSLQTREAARIYIGPVPFIVDLFIHDHRSIQGSIVSTRLLVDTICLAASMAACMQGAPLVLDDFASRTNSS